jgi:hypothetical protein
MITAVTPSIVARFTFGTLNVSTNVKIGPVYATYRAVGTDYTCPPDCVMAAATTALCYADAHHVGAHQRRARAMVLDVADYIISRPARKDGKTLGIRHLVSGDLKERGKPSWAYIDGMARGHAARPDMYGWGYTHAWRELPIARVNAGETYTINASCETDGDIRQALDAGWSPVTIVKPDAPAGIDPERVTDAYAILTCPQQTGRATCDTCRLCAYPVASPKRQWRGLPVVIGFRVHGSINKVSAAINAEWRRVIKAGAVEYDTAGTAID